MNKKIIILISICLFIICGCDKDEINVTTGIIGTVEYGHGDCMPVIDYGSREYNNYNGKIYFVVKDDWDNLGDGDYAQLKNNSINVQVNHGKLSAELPSGTYLVMPEDFVVYTEESTITITSKEVITRDFKFFKCISF